MNPAIRILLFATALAIPTAASAALTININQTGPNVVATASGTISLSGLTFIGPTVSDNSISPAIGFLGTGTPDGSALNAYSGITGPQQFGSGGYTDASSGAGDVFALAASGTPRILVANGFVSGSQIDSSATFSSATFASLGLTAGQYIYTWSGDSITLNVGAGSVPELSTWAMMLVGLGGIGLLGRRKRRLQQAMA